MSTQTCLRLFAALILIRSADGNQAVAAPEPIQVFILAGQSNMEGQAVADLDGKYYNDGKGTLTALLSDPKQAPRFTHLRTSNGDWGIRDDVWVRYKRERGPLLAGPLTVGFSVYGDKHHFGPELEFGHVIGDRTQQQVLIIKTAWGGKSLYKDFRPPSSGGDVGPYYTKMIAEIREALASLKTDFPGYQGGGYERGGGGVWYQGWNDGVGEQPGIRGDLTTEEFQLQHAVEIDPQIALLAVTHRVPRSAAHKLAESPWFSWGWRKSHAEDRELNWEMWGDISTFLTGRAV